METEIKRKTQDEQPRPLIQEVKHETLDGKPSETTLKKFGDRKIYDKVTVFKNGYCMLKQKDCFRQKVATLSLHYRNRNKKERKKECIKIVMILLNFQ